MPIAGSRQLLRRFRVRASPSHQDLHRTHHQSLLSDQCSQQPAVSYDFAHEIVPTIPAFELSYRYQFGLNLDLPGGWTGQIFDSRSYETNQYILTLVNDNAVNVALGTPTGGVTKPGAVPYLNLFCDVSQFQCNSPATLNYITSPAHLGRQVQHRGENRPLRRPAVRPSRRHGQGGRRRHNMNRIMCSAMPATIPARRRVRPFRSSTMRSPIRFGPASPRSTFRCSGRISTFPCSASSIWKPHGVTTNITARSMAAPAIPEWHLPGDSRRILGPPSEAHGEPRSVSPMPANIPPCSATPTAPSTSPAGTPVHCRMLRRYAGCGQRRRRRCSRPVSAAIRAPGGLSWSGGPHPELRSLHRCRHRPARNARGRPRSRAGEVAQLQHRLRTGADRPSCKGLDLQATWYSVKVNGTLLGFNTTTANTLADPLERFHIILPSDLGCPVAANANPHVLRAVRKNGAGRSI